MRIAWAVPGAFDQRTGGYLYDRLIVEGLLARGDHIEIVGIAPGVDPEELVRAITDHRPEVVVGDALAVAELGPAFARLDGSVTILLVHHLTSWEEEAADRPSRRSEEARAVRASDALIATSAATRRRLAQDYGRIADVVVPGADRLSFLATPGRALAARGDGEVVLLFVGSLLPRKRLPLLLDAMDRLAEPHVELRIVGDPARDAHHARSIDALVAQSPHLSARVAMLGPVDDGTLAQELHQADALVLPSSLEGYGMVLTEALHAGVPVIAARAWAPHEVSGAPEAALLFDGLEGLLASLRRFATDPGLRARMRRAAQAQRASLPTWSGASTLFREALTRAATREARAPRIGLSR